MSLSTAAGNLYVADTDNHTLREIAPSGAVSTLAGLAGSSGSADGAGTAARFAFPTGVAVDSSGDVYVADTNNQTIRLGCYPGSSGDRAAATEPDRHGRGERHFHRDSHWQARTNLPMVFQCGTAISGATSSTLNLTNVQTSDAGNYTVTVTNGSGTTSNAALTVNAGGGGVEGAAGAAAAE